MKYEFFTLLFLVFTLSSSLFSTSHSLFQSREVAAYPTKNGSDFLRALHQQKELILDPTPFLLPKNHAVKIFLDSLFSKKNIIENKKTFVQAGFHIIEHRQTSFIYVARHPKVPGCIFKVYMDTEPRHRISKSNFSGQDWLIRRCQGAHMIQTFLKEKNIHHFTVPKKYLYEVPHNSKRINRRTFILIADDMNLVSSKKSKRAWKKKITSQHVNELFALMKNGCASTHLPSNIPYTKAGTFAFIDTEYPRRICRFKKATQYLSTTMQKKWNRLVNARKTSTHESSLVQRR